MLGRLFELVGGAEDNSVPVPWVVYVALEVQVHPVPDLVKFINVLPDSIGGGDHQVATGPVARDVKPDATVSRLHQSPEL